MIIFGTRGVTLTKDKGHFYCPECRSQRQYALKRIRRFFTLYFIPLIPLDKLGDFVECKTCRNSFRESILNYEPDAAEVKFESEYQKAIRRVTIQMMCADGRVNDSTMQVIKEIHKNVSGSQISTDEIKKEISADRRNRSSVRNDLVKLALHMNDNGKELIFKSAFCVAAADGKIQKKEKELLEEIVRSLDMSPSHVKGVIAELTGNE